MARATAKAASRSGTLAAKVTSVGSVASRVSSVAARSVREANSPPWPRGKHERATWNVDSYVRRFAKATPMEIVEIERQGVRGSFIKDLARRLEIPTSRMFGILGVPKATAEKKAAAGEMVRGSGGQAAIAMVKLLVIAGEILANSTAPEAKGFDAAKWLGQWIERPQPSLGGRRAADLIDTPTGVDVVARLLGSIASGAYQ